RTRSGRPRPTSWPPGPGGSGPRSSADPRAPTRPAWRSTRSGGGSSSASTRWSWTPPGACRPRSGSWARWARASGPARGSGRAARGDAGQRAARSGGRAVAGARRPHGPERPVAGAGLHRGRERDRRGVDQAGRHRQGRYHSRRTAQARYPGEAGGVGGGSRRSRPLRPRPVRGCSARRGNATLVTRTYPPRPEEVPLVGGNVSTVVRVANTVRRNTGPWTPAVHALLRHLEKVGFTGAPRVVGLDDRGREVLPYVEGECGEYPLAPHWVTDEALTAVATMLRRFHDAQRGF